MWGMVDLETLDTKASAVILSVGMVAFDKDEPIVTASEQDFYKSHIAQALHFYVDVPMQVKAGRTINWSTIQWWMQQEDAAKKVFEDEDRLPPSELNKEIVAFVKDHKIDKMWAYPATFDHAILNDYWEMFGLKNPVHYTHQLDMRTPRYLTQTPRPPRISWMTPHNAMWDCVDQAVWLQNIMKDMQK